MCYLYLHEDVRKFFPVIQQNICPIVQLDNRNLFVVHPDTWLSYRKPGCVTSAWRPVMQPGKLSISAEHNNYICSAPMLNLPGCIIIEDRYVAA